MLRITKNLKLRSIRSIRSSIQQSIIISHNNIKDNEYQRKSTINVRNFTSSSSSSTPSSSSSSSSAAAATTTTTTTTSSSGLFGLDSNVASEKFKGRWLMAVPAVLTHMCVGSPWAWSLMADVVTREVGYVII